MRNTIRTCISLALLSLSFLLSAQTSIKDIEKAFSLNELEHPYLLFDSKGREKMLQDIEKDQHLKEIHERLLLEAYRYLKMPVNDVIPPAGDASRFFSGNEMRGFMRVHYHAALNLAFVYQLTGENKYAEKAFLHAEMLCRLESWVYPFHEFPQIYDRVWPWNVDDDQVVFSFDLQSARIATHLAFVYDWIYPALDKAKRDRLRGALLENAITRVRGDFEYHWWSSAYRCNWSGICYSGAGLASLALLTEDPQLMDVVSAAYNGVSNMLNELGPDGGWQEGRGYWAYGVGHSMWFMEAVKRLTLGEYNLFQHPRLKENPADFPLYTMIANFGDGRSGPVGDSWFINKLVTETEDQTAAWYAEEFIRKGDEIFDLIWAKPPVKAVEPDIKSKHFRGIDWAVMQSSFVEDNSFTIACKAGYNDDPHHGHLDCGHFILSYNGEKFIKDIGGASYDDFYFSAERWDYVEASSRGHNVILVNGEEQISAKLKDQPWKNGVGGIIDDFYTSDTMDYISMSGLHKTYPGIELKSWRRQIILMKPSLAVVLDRIETEPGAEIRSRIHPGESIDIHEEYYTIKSSDEELTVLPFTDQEVKITQGRHSSISVNDDADIESISYVDCVIKTPEAQTISGYIIFPSKGAEGTGEVIQTIQLKKGKNEEVSLSFSIDDESHNIIFPGEK